MENSSSCSSPANKTDDSGSDKVVKKLPFGHPALASFELDASLTFINHGSLGAVPKHIQARRRALQLEMERSPDIWFRYSSAEKWRIARQSLATYLRLPMNNLVLCLNTSDAINAVLKSISFDGGSNDAILATNLTFPGILQSVDYTAKYRLKDNERPQVFLLPMRFPIDSVEQLLTDFDRLCHEIVVERRLRLRLALIDHISSAAPLLFPVEAMCRRLRAQTGPDTFILIDGAHAIGHVADLDIAALDCDFYVSNVHKWFVCTRGSSFLYFRDLANARASLEPNYISFGYGNVYKGDTDDNSGVVANFLMRGTIDLTNLFVVADCVEYHTRALGGVARVHAYCGELLERATQMLEASWSTRRLAIVKELEAPLMRLVELPVLRSYRPGESLRLLRDCIDRFRLVSYFVDLNERLYVRLSCFVYNEMSDYEKLRDAIIFFQNN